ncbi:MAG: cytochrome c3 family protein [Syntrophales bacterium]
MSRTRRYLIFVLSALIPVMTAAVVGAAEGTCLSCHGKKNILNKGTHLYIDPAKYELTTHARIGCAACHTKVTQRHPADGVRPSRAKCEDCHAAVYAEYEKSTHSAYAGCTDCHKPHAVKPLLAVSGRDINIQCAKCHDHSETVKSHTKWLPQAALHIDALPCITCHTGSKDTVITLYMAKRVGDSPLGGVTLAGYEDLRSFIPPGKKVGRVIDTNGDGAVSLAELKEFNTSSQFKHISLLGTMMPEVVTHSYQIMANRWDCTFCHASGPNVQQTSQLAFPEQDGTYSRMIVEKGAILDILYGTPDFYMTGFTRNKTLSIIGILIVVSGLMVPILHGTLRFLTRSRRKER